VNYGDGLYLLGVWVDWPGLYEEGALKHGVSGSLPGRRHGSIA
jgi:hypothetical protein